MIHTEQQPGASFEELVALWSRAAGEDPGPLQARTVAAFAALAPSQLPLVEPLVQRLLEKLDTPAAASAARTALFALLDRVRRRNFTEPLPARLVDAWTALVVRVVERADYTIPELLRSRARTDPDVVALRLLGPEALDLTIAEVAGRARRIARGLAALLGEDPEPVVAILSENSLEAALCDLACLGHGLVDVPVPANSTGPQVQYILEHSGARVVLVSSEEQLAKIAPAFGRLTKLETVVMLAPAAAERHGMLSLDQLIALGDEAGDGPLERRLRGLRSGDLATVMYTSGTTGQPKGIAFTQLNAVSKRFCRAFALREVNEGDVFLCYLPLFHTFGRWLELLGSLFWGATYVFARSPARATLFEDFEQVRPSVFISVPKKWMELHEHAAQQADSFDPDAIAARLQRITGGRLRFGLSAAGYLDPVVFRAMYRAGVALCSGYGMTEATGGITMTPPEEYLETSIGRPLPGIECRRAPDGELLIRGPYVMPGYFRPPDGDTGLDAQGWFATGDLVQMNPRGHLRLVGRKKEIYKNRKGQTIAPARVENLFRDFEAIGQAFLVGDHREYNTLLIWPNYEGQPVLAERSPEELRALLGSLVVSANRFLAPFERVVAFAILDRPLSEERGELTAKGTFKREVVEQHFQPVIDSMYQEIHVTLAVDGFEVRIPNWVMREMGVLRQDLALRDRVLMAGERKLRVFADIRVPGALRVGDFHYFGADHGIDFGAVLSTPSLWLGNQALQEFVGEDAFLALVSRRRDPSRQLRAETRYAPGPNPRGLARLEQQVEGEEISLASLHAAAILMRGDGKEAQAGLRHLERGLALRRSELSGLSRAVLRRAAVASDAGVRRRAFLAVLPGGEPEAAVADLRAFLELDGDGLLTDDVLAALAQRTLADGQVKALIGAVEGQVRASVEPPSGEGERTLLRAAIRLLTAYVITHPAWFERLRVPLAQLLLQPDRTLATRAAQLLDRLQQGFRERLGPVMRQASDPRTGAAYGWPEVVEFQAEVAGAHRSLLLEALASTSLLAEAGYLFGRGVVVGLGDLAPGGVRVSWLGARHGKTVYRLSVQTRACEQFDVAVNLAGEVPADELRDEMRWLQAAGGPPPLVEAFGGWYPEFGIFTEEFIPGGTIESRLERFALQGASERLEALWPFQVWTALSVHVAFWERTGFRLALAEPGPASVVVPSHDYQVGARLVSIAHRSPCEGAEDLINRFQEAFVAPVEAAHPELAGQAPPAVMLAAFLEVLGEQRGAEVLETARGSRWGEAIDEFLGTMDRRGYTPKPAWFAARRYRRWSQLNPEATREARATMLSELWRTYRLDEVEARWPDTRVRFFRQTVFAEARPVVLEALDPLMARLRAQGRAGVNLEEEVAAIRTSVDPTPDTDFFLARMTFRHLTPNDQATLISMPTGERQVTEVAISFVDRTGEAFFLRSPVSPREVARLLHLFHAANLQVVFTAEHEYLLALDARDVLVGGIFYRLVGRDRAHLEKIVVDRRYRKRGLSAAMMNELMRRLRGRGIRVLETGFFHPHYMGRFGLHTEPRYGGLVRELTVEPPEGPP